jgi:hypothetical protein
MGHLFICISLLLSIPVADARVWPCCGLFIVLTGHRQRAANKICMVMLMIVSSLIEQYRSIAF